MIQSKKVKYLLVALFTGLMVTLFVLYNTSERLQKERKYVPVDNASTFFTVASCANRYIEYLSSRDVNSLKLVLNSKYNIDEEMNKFNESDVAYTIKVKKIYQAKMNKNNVKYYVYGLLRKDQIDEFDFGTPYYLIIDIDTDSYTYTVSPYDGKVFE